MVCRSWALYSGRVHFSEAMCPVTRRGRIDARGAPGAVKRCRTTSTEWQAMSFSTPPPCRSPRQNHGRWGPLCSSAARAR